MTDAPQPAAKTKKRRPWLAAILSFFWLGLGQLYNGDGRRAVIFLSIELAFYVASAAILVGVTSPAVLLGAAGFVAAAVLTARAVAVIDAYRRARRMGIVALRRYQRVWAYLAIVAVAFGLSEIMHDVFYFHGGCDGVARPFTHSYSISSSSMAPTLVLGDYVLGESGYFCRNRPKRGDLAIFLSPLDGKTIWVKRIVGLPGDRVQLKKGRLYLNGDPVTRDWVESAIHTEATGDARAHTRFVESFPDAAPYVIEIADQNAKLENTDEITVPPARYFVLGDNRDYSADSRMAEFGVVPGTYIADHPAFIYWSASWDRIGRWVQ